jgi:MoaA/NifB/PqqE/SkfB family radical SAM enzyme
MTYDEDLDRDRRRAQALSPRERQDACDRILARAPLFDIEAASACDLACSFCPRRDLGSAESRMSPGTFRDLLAFLPADAVVMFSGLGEPLLNPHLEEFVAALKQRGISSCVITNGLGLTPRRQASLIAAGIDQFQISLHALTPQSWSQIAGRPRGLDTVVVNVDHLARNRPPTLRVRLNFVRTDADGAEEGPVRDYAAEQGLDLFVRRMHSRGGRVDTARRNDDVPGCGILAAVTFVTAQGEVLACSNDVRRETRVGYVGDLTWSAVVDWKRRALSAGPVLPPCAGCNDDYRWVILAHESVDVPPPDGATPTTTQAPAGHDG